MKVFSGFRIGAVIVIGGLLLAAPGRAQTIVTLSISNAPGPISVSNSLTYSLSVTNLLGPSLVAGWITNDIAGPAVVTAATPVLPGEGAIISSNSTQVVFILGPFATSTVEQFSLTVIPTGTGIFSNTITLFAVSSTDTNTLSQPVETEVTNGATIAQADLTVSVTGPDVGALVGDFIPFGITVSNLGSTASFGVVVSNSFSPSVNFVSGSMTNGGFLSVGTLSGGAVTNLNLRVQPTTNGPLSFTAVVTSLSPADPNPTNNTATTNIVVGAFITNQITVSNVTGQVYDPQTGSVEQTIRLVNVGTNTAASARVIAFGFGASNALENAVGTNNAVNSNGGDPFVVYGAPLAVSNSIDLVMEFFLHDRAPVPAFSNYLAVPGPAVDLTATFGGLTNGTRVVPLSSGRVLVEFPSILGRSYTILYSDSLTYTNRAEPPIVAPADRVQWIDAGPPKTFQFPETNRSYRVLLNP